MLELPNLIYPKTYGPHDDIRRNVSHNYFYRAFYYPYMGKPLGFRLKIPDNFNPETEYPLMIWGGGNSTGRKIIENYDNNVYHKDMQFGLYPATWFSNTFSEMIYLIPQIIDWTEWLNEAQNDSSHLEYILQTDLGRSFWGGWGNALRELILSLIQGNAPPYKTAYCDENAMWENFTFPKINPNKIYGGGYSGGAFSIFCVLDKLRDIISGIWSMAGQPFGGAYKDHWSPYSDDYSDAVIDRLSLLAEYWCHIPIFCSVCTSNGMYHSCKAFATSIQNACEKHNKTNKFYLRVVDYKDYLMDTWSSSLNRYDKNSAHWDAYEWSPCSSTGNLIDFTIHSEQKFKTNTLYVDPYYVLGTDNKTYKCILPHISSDLNKPITGENFSQYWSLTNFQISGETWNGGEEWIDNTKYPAFPVIGTDGKDYVCRKPHISDSTNKPITGADYLQYWQITSGEGYGDEWENNKFYPSQCFQERIFNTTTNAYATTIYPGARTFGGAEYIGPSTPSYSPSSPELTPYTDTSFNSPYISPINLLRNYWTKDTLESPVDLDPNLISGNLNNLPYILIYPTSIPTEKSQVINFDEISLEFNRKRNLYLLERSPLYLFYQTKGTYLYIYYLDKTDNNLKIFSRLFGDIISIDKNAEIIDLNSFRIRYFKEDILELFSPRQYVFW